MRGVFCTLNAKNEQLTTNNSYHYHSTRTKQLPAPTVVNDEDWANEYDASEYRSDWENIWADM